MGGEDCNSKACMDKPNVDELKKNNLSNYLNKNTQIENFYPERILYRTEIGRISWRVFHRFSVLFENTEDDKIHFNNFVNGVKSFFPCSTCKRDFAKDIIRTPLSDIFNLKDSNQVNDEVIKWVCIQHNYVNTKIRKKTNINCDLIRNIKSDYNF